MSTSKNKLSGCYDSKMAAAPGDKDVKNISLPFLQTPLAETYVLEQFQIR
jgi:hypothetical protein